MAGGGRGLHGGGGDVRREDLNFPHIHAKHYFWKCLESNDVIYILWNKAGKKKLGVWRDATKEPHLLVDCLPCKSQKDYTLQDYTLEDYTLPEMFIKHLCLECITTVTVLIEALIWIQIITLL